MIFFIIKLVFIVVYVIILYWGLKWLIRMDIISGLFVRLSFIGCGIFGNINGIFFKIYFNVMLKKMGIRLGWFSFFMEFFKIFLVWVIVSLLLIIVIWLFICNCKCGEVIKFIFEWLIWVMFVLKLFCILSCESIFLFNLGFVIKMWCEISFLFNCFYFIFICLLKNIVIVLMLIGFEIIRILLLICNIVFEFISFIFCCLLWWCMCEMMKLWFIKGCIFLMVFLCIVLFFIFNVMGCMVSFCKCFNFFLVLVFFCDVLILRMYFSVSNERMVLIIFKG